MPFGRIKNQDLQKDPARLYFRTVRVPFVKQVYTVICYDCICGRINQLSIGVKEEDLLSLIGEALLSTLPFPEESVHQALMKLCMSASYFLSLISRILLQYMAF